MPTFTTALPPYDESFLEELVPLAQLVFGEFDQKQLEWRFENMPDCSVQLARSDSLVGFKIGYAVAPHRYHSWYGGVIHGSRRTGVARTLMQLQHDWAKSRGYAEITANTTADNSAMLSLNLQAGFTVIGTFWRGESKRISMARAL